MRVKSFIIKQIAKQFRKRIAVAKNLKVQHISYMQSYSYPKLLRSYIKSLTL